MISVAIELAEWAANLAPTGDDFELADRSLLDIAVAIVGRDEPVVTTAAALSDATCWAIAGHVLDFDDLHMASTAHISVDCLPAVLAAGGGAHACLAAAGVMARLGTALGWSHYSAEWHTTSMAGAPAALNRAIVKCLAHGRKFCSCFPCRA